MNASESDRAFKTYMNGEGAQDIIKEKITTKRRAAKLVRTVTVAPIMAAALIALLYYYVPGAYSASHAWLAVTFLSVLPVLAYPVSNMIPSIRAKGRDGQRNLAIVFSVIGYVAGLITVVTLNPARIERIIYLTYTFSGVQIALFSGVFKLKASGHACGVAGPIWALCYFVSPWFAFALIALGLVFWSSLVLKRHTLAQLFVGSAIPALSMLLSILLVG